LRLLVPAPGEDDAFASGGTSDQGKKGGGGFIDRFFGQGESEPVDGTTVSDSHPADAPPLGRMIEDAGATLASAIPTTAEQSSGDDIFTADGALSEPERKDNDPQPGAQGLEPLET
jgi:hypothetical protein